MKPEFRGRLDSLRFFEENTKEVSGDEMSGETGCESAPELQASQAYDGIPPDISAHSDDSGLTSRDEMSGGKGSDDTKSRKVWTI